MVQMKWSHFKSSKRSKLRNFEISQKLEIIKVPRWDFQRVTQTFPTQTKSVTQPPKNDDLILSNLKSMLKIIEKII